MNDQVERVPSPRQGSLSPFRQSKLALAPWKYAAVFLLGLGLTAVVVVVELYQLQRAQESVAIERAATIASTISREIDTYAVPTIAGETYVASRLADRDSSESKDADLVANGFDAFTGPLRRDLGEALLDYQIAPVGVVTYSTYPERNSQALGHNLLRDDDRREQAITAINERRSVVAGPFDLLQGGRGIVIRKPIFLDGLASFEERYADFAQDSNPHPWLTVIPDDFWGFSTAVVDFTKLLDQAGVEQFDPAEASLRPVSADGQDQEPIWGNGEVNARTAELRFTLPDEREWLVTVNPRPVEANLLWPVGLIGLLLSAMGTLFYGRYFRARKAEQFGYEYTTLIRDTSGPEGVAQLTADFLVETYPKSSGLISVNNPGGLQIQFGDPPAGFVDSSKKALASHGGTRFTRTIDRNGRTYAVIDVLVPSSYSRKDISAFLDVLHEPLASALATMAHQEYLEHESSTDHLTSLRNRRLLQPTYEDLAAVAARQGQVLSLAVLDIDYFKDVNDQQGHQFGDLVLQRLAAALNDTMRDADTIFRFGGDEFVILALTENVEDASFAFARVQEAANVSLAAMLSGVDRQHTCSIGVATCAQSPFPPLAQVLSAADAALYSAKNKGRNRVETTVLATPPTVAAPN